MIVIGILVPGAPSTTMVVEIARRAAGTGARTEVAGVAPIGPVGDRQLVELAAAGVGHATVTRSAAAGIEPADLELALRYLPDIRAIVLVEPLPSLLATSVAASAWSGATLVVVGVLDAEAIAVIDAAASRPIVIEAPARDPDAAFAGVVAALAVRLDAGEDPATAGNQPWWPSRSIRHKRSSRWQGSDPAPLAITIPGWLYAENIARGRRPEGR